MEPEGTAEDDAGEVSDDVDDKTDSDVAEAWEEFDIGRQYLARRHAQAEASLTMPVEKRFGYIELGGKIIGRIACQPRLIANPSIHISCKEHLCCQR